jgi:hypothetical protein
MISSLPIHTLLQMSELQTVLVKVHTAYGCQHCTDLLLGSLTSSTLYAASGMWDKKARCIMPFNDVLSDIINLSFLKLNYFRFYGLEYIMRGPEP